MAALGVARLDDRDLLVEAGGGLVVAALGDVSRRGPAGGAVAGGPGAPPRRERGPPPPPPGPERRAAAELRKRLTQQPPGVWTLVYDSFDPARQGLREALCALGNGYFVTRGALPEAEADDVHYPGTYVAGLYDRAETEVAGRMVDNEDLVNVPNGRPLAGRDDRAWAEAAGRRSENEDLVNVPNSPPLRFRIAGGGWFDARRSDVVEHRFELDMRRGMLSRDVTWQDAEGRRTQMNQ